MYATPQDAVRSPRETLLYTVGLYTGTPIAEPDYLATVDVDPGSATYGRVIHRLPMPNLGDELHHFGWNACSSCHGDPRRSRDKLIIPGLRSSRIYIVSVENPAAPRLSRVIEPDEIMRKTNLSAPHTSHCLPDGHVLISMLGDARGDAPGGFLLLDDRFNVAGRWERDAAGMRYNYDFWYQPRHNIMISSEFAAPNTYYPGFDLKDVEAGKYGQRLHFWDWSQRRLERSVDLGSEGRIPLEVRFLHDPASTHGFVGAALSSTVWHWYQDAAGTWRVEKVVEVPPVPTEGWNFPVPGLITDILVSMDDKFLYFSDWLHGDVRQYDIADPARPRLTGQVWCGGVIGRKPDLDDRRFSGGPQMLQLSLDGRRLYVTNSLLSSWDNQFYPPIAQQGSYLLQIDCDPRGGMKLNERFFVDFGREPAGPARAHEMRFPGGDCSSDIFV
ncbi:MAG: selenium-binding family protein [Planctomycetes bacterium]|nr:selenium-binding family protein [Planctomycetota bacterium]